VKYSEVGYIIMGSKILSYYTHITFLLVCHKYFLLTKFTQQYLFNSPISGMNNVAVFVNSAHVPSTNDHHTFLTLKKRANLQQNYFLSCM